jgi:MATE family multidrug resistance protein
VLISSGLVFLPAWYLTLPMALHGLWLSFVLFNLARGASLGAVFWWRLRNSAALTG